MQELEAYAGQDDNFELASQRLEKYLRVKVSSSQVARVTKTYGDKLESLSISEPLINSQEVRAEIKDLPVGQPAYVMMDGSMLLTREDSDWKEIKLGRIFHAGEHFELSNSRKWIRKSLYVSHLGSSSEFLKKLEPLVDEYDQLGKELVFVNDGAKWIWTWIDQHYPNSTKILDYFHATERLSQLAKVIFKDKAEQEQWVSEQKELLLNNEVSEIIRRVKAMDLKGKTKEEARKKFLTYYENNQERMYYKTYQEKGFMIGSGPIEAAHRNVIQKRLKQSGQRWTISGAQAVANLRVVNMSGKWEKVIQIIKKAA